MAGGFLLGTSFPSYSIGGFFGKYPDIYFSRRDVLSCRREKLKILTLYQSVSLSYRYIHPKYLKGDFDFSHFHITQLLIMAIM